MKAGLSSLGVAGMALAAVLWIVNVSLAAESNMPIPSPQAVYNQAVRDAEPKGKGTGEGFCWHAAYHMRAFVEAYQASHDPAWLDAGVKYYDWCVGKMAVGPDGYKGWIGPVDNGLWYDDHVGDAILVERMLEFSELVLKDPRAEEEVRQGGQPIRRDRQEGPHREVGQARHLARGRRVRGLRRPQQGLRAGETHGVEGRDRGGGRAPGAARCSSTSRTRWPLGALRLYRITGEKPYLEKARKIFTFMRSRFQYVADKDYYVWNYWGPFGPWDVDVEKQTTRHWVGVHRYRNYQAEEIRQIAEAYHTGIVFTQLDIERIINTNLKVMWNGDKANPKWVNSDALLPKPVLTPAQKKAQEDEENSNPYAKEGRAGTLWTALDDFSQTVRNLEAPRGNVPARDSRAIVGPAYFQNVTLKTPPSMDRRYAKDAEVEQAPVTDCPSLTVATVLPHILSAKPSVVLCKSRLANDLEVAVYSADGKDKKCVLYKGKIGSGMNGQSDTLILTWDGADPATKAKLPKGNCTVRWTVQEGCREYVVTIPE